MNLLFWMLPIDEQVLNFLFDVDQVGAGASFNRRNGIRRWRTGRVRRLGAAHLQWADWCQHLMK